MVSTFSSLSIFNKICVPLSFTIPSCSIEIFLVGRKIKKPQNDLNAAFMYKKAADCDGARGSQFLCMSIIETEQQTPSVR